MTQEIKNFERTYLMNNSSQETNLYHRKIEFAEQVKAKIEKLRYLISYKETELVLIFRELMSWDYHIPEHYFEEQKYKHDLVSKLTSHNSK